MSLPRPNCCHLASGWALLLALTMLTVGGLEYLQQPAAVLLGAILAGMAMAGLSRSVSIPRSGLGLAQGLIGCMIASSIQLPALQSLAGHWPLFLLAVLTVIAVSYGLGWLLMRWQVLPGTSAIWGASPGGAMAMVVVAEAYGEDIRLVAFMQYSRVLMVAAVASLVTSMWAVDAGDVLMESKPGHGRGGWPNPGWLLATLGLASSGLWLQRWLVFPAKALLLPMLGGVLLQATLGFRMELPWLLLAASYALIGWNIGQRFTRQTVRLVAKALPSVLISAIGLIAICAGLSVLLAKWLHLDPLTAYLAMSPGGVDSVAIIAANSGPVDMSVVMAMQTARFLLILWLGPWLAKQLADRSGLAPSHRVE